jgi:hypothetical protein
VGFVVALGQVFSPSTSVFPCQFYSITWKNKKKKLIIFITGLHNKLGCGASVASAAGLFTTNIKVMNTWVHE